MSMRKCPKCGELYSDTYKTCPFCEEDEAWAEGRSVHRRSNGRRMANQREPSVLGPILMVVIVILACLLVWFLFGEKIMNSLGLGAQSNPPPVSSVEPSGSEPGDVLDEPENPDVAPPVVGGDGSGGDTPDTSGGTAGTAGGSTAGTTGGGTAGTTGGTTGGGADTTGSSGGQKPDATDLPETLKLSSSDFTLFMQGETTKLTVTGGDGPFTWSSSNGKVVTVSGQGVVTAVGDGIATITVSNGSAKATCTARCRGVGAAPASSGGGGTGANGVPVSTNDPKLNHSDFTMKVGDAAVQLKVIDSGSAVTWASQNTAVATVSSGGAVTAVAKGTTNVTATVDGKTLTCIVRVNPA